jgi:hypothetical protein
MPHVRAGCGTGPSSEFCNVIAVWQSDLPCALSRFMKGIQLHPFLLWWSCYIMSCHVMLCRIMLCRLLHCMGWRRVVWYICASVFNSSPREGRQQFAPKGWCLSTKLHGNNVHSRHGENLFYYLIRRSFWRCQPYSIEGQGDWWIMIGKDVEGSGL